MNYYTYIIESKTSGKLYIGHTSHLEKRIKRHNDGGSLYTRNRGPWKLIFSKESQTRSEAVLLEKKLKGFKNPQKVRDWIELQKEDG